MDLIALLTARLLPYESRTYRAHSGTMESTVGITLDSLALDRIDQFHPALYRHHRLVVANAPAIRTAVVFSGVGTRPTGKPPLALSSPGGESLLARTESYFGK